ncbi:MAG: MFS transporter [Sulfitobacter sp.]
MLTTPYRRFITASGLVNLADGVAVVAWAWLASLLTRDPLLVALVPVALRLPWFLCAVPAGIITDRTDRRLLILRADIFRGLIFAAVGLVLFAALPLPAPTQSGVSDPMIFGLILGAAALVGGAEVFRDNAAQTMLPAIVPDADLETANGRLWSVELVGNALLGPALGAFLIAHAVFAPFALNAVAYVLAFLFLLPLRGHYRPKVNIEGRWQAEMMEGVNFLRASPVLLTLAWITGLWNFLNEMVLVALVLHVQENLFLGAQAYGMILAAGAVGGILGGWYGDRVVARLGPLRSLQWMLVAGAPAFLAIALAPGAVSLAVILMVFSSTGLVWNTVSVSYRQRMIPDVLLGRVNSLYRLFAWGMMPVGLMLSGMIVHLADGFVSRNSALVAPFLVAALGSVFLGGIGWRALARHWRE